MASTIMTSKLLCSLLFIIGLVLLQQVIAATTSHVQVMERHSALIMANDLDPSALFYMEIDQALDAEKQVRRTLATRQ